MSATKRKVVVNDRLQGCVHWRTEPVGRNFAPGLPDLTPKEMLRLGVFGGK